MSLRVVDTHTEGMPTRVVVAGLPDAPGATTAERAAWFAAHHDDLRRVLVLEPRGHDAMYAALVLPPLDPANTCAVLYAEADGYLPSCGHATIGVAAALVDQGRLPVRADGRAELRVESVSGVVTADVDVAEGRARSVSLRTVPSFVLARDVRLASGLTVDVAYGGNFYAIVPAAAAGVRVDPSDARALVDAGLRVMAETDEALPVVHPTKPDVRGCQHTMFTDGHRSAVVIYTGVIDRSPCGTGTSARLALLTATGELPLGDQYRHESILRTAFSARVVGSTEVGGLPAVLAEITGRAWVTARSEIVIEDNDPFPEGFRLRG